MSIPEIYVAVIYQPFLNILVGIYWLLSQLPTPIVDMGVAVILFTVVVRVIMLPLTFNSEKGEEDRRKIEKHLAELESTHTADPIMLRNETKKLLRKNRRVVISESIELGIQVILALMLWRIFARGLSGEDLHLIYTWMPKVHQPFQLVFMGKYDLTHPHLSLNILQSLLIMILETLHIISSPHKVSQKEVVRMELTLPIVSFMIFAFLPAGKKLFVITALIFSIVYKLFRMIQQFFKTLMPSPAQEEAEEESKQIGDAPAHSGTDSGSTSPDHGTSH